MAQPSSGWPTNNPRDGTNLGLVIKKIKKKKREVSHMVIVKFVWLSTG